MENEQTNNAQPTGTENDNTLQEGKANNSNNNEANEATKTPSQVLKEENDALERELIRAQKIRNETLLAGTGGGNQKVEPKEETPEEYVKKIMSGKYEEKKD